MSSAVEKKNQKLGEDTKIVLPDRVHFWFDENKEGKGEAFNKTMKRIGDILSCQIELLRSEPRMYTIRNLLTAQEHKDIIARVSETHSSSWKRSYTETETGKRIKDDERTSQYIWFMKDDPTTVKLEKRVAALVGVPPENVEPMQVVRYLKGQYFNIHHDAGTIVGDDEKEAKYVLEKPYRLCSIFLYLTKTFPNSGCTEFPMAKPPLKQQPEENLALFWCNVVTSGKETGQIDPRVIHQALPVSYDREVKVGMNIWIRDTSFWKE